MIRHEGSIQHRPIHYSDKFPVVKTACGAGGPATSEWEYVTCPMCLELRVAYRELE